MGRHSISVDVDVDIDEFDDEAIRDEFDRRFVKKGKPPLPVHAEIVRIRDDLERGDIEHALFIVDGLLRPKWRSVEECQLHFVKTKEEWA